MSEDQLAYWTTQAFRLSIVLAILLLIAEGFWPRSTARKAFGRRWVANLSVYTCTFAVAWMLAPLTLIGAAALASDRVWGLLNWISVPLPLAIVVSILVVDLCDFAIHWLEHRSGWLWRLHRLHHSDPDLDVTSTYRFHPFEVLLRSVGHAVAAIAIGMPPIAAVIYLLLSTATSVLSHANLRLPRRSERALGMLVLTPGIHRIHHSTDARDSNSNFGVCLTIWDRVFGTFRARPVSGDAAIAFGVASRTPDEATSVLLMLADPFLLELPELPDSTVATERAAAQD